ncbi:MAG: DNA alkylation repair protein [Spirochaetales bacterium]|nr:DNA alkylation repair protein [Spirochaetales bacterium]
MNGHFALTPQLVQKDLDALGKYKTADVDRLIRGYVKKNADASLLREHVLTQRQFHRIYFYVSLEQIKNADGRMAFIHKNLLFSDWWHTDELIGYVADLNFERALKYAAEYIKSEEPFVRRWGYVLFISRLGRGHAEQLLPLMKNDGHYYVQMGEAWLIAELAVTEPENVHKWMATCGLDYKICGKAIQKICDSYRISQDWKEKFKELRAELKDKPAKK